MHFNPMNSGLDPILKLGGGVTFEIEQAAERTLVQVFKDVALLEQQGVKNVSVMRVYKLSKRFESPHVHSPDKILFC